MVSLNDILNDNLKICLQGKEKFLFLINDSNQELNQHFNPNYESTFNLNNFLKNYHFKKTNFENNNIEYYYFVIPDKSVVCKDFLPFEWNILKRNINKIKEIPDFTNILTFEDYFKYDSHINYKGGLKLTYKILNHIDKDFTVEHYINLLSNCDKIISRRYYDLLFDMNWSYSIDEKKKFETSGSHVNYKPKTCELIGDYPLEFKYYENNKNRPSFYCINKEAITNLKILILGGSSFEMHKWYFSVYFKDVLFYWDHGTLNPDLIKWYKPDIIIELREERFIENIKSPEWVINREKFII